MCVNNVDILQPVYLMAVHCIMQCIWWLSSSKILKPVKLVPVPNVLCLMYYAVYWVAVKMDNGKIFSQCS